MAASSGVAPGVPARVAARRARFDRRCALRRRLRSLSDTIASSQGRKAAPSRNPLRLRNALMNASWVTSSASSPVIVYATRTATLRWASTRRNGLTITALGAVDELGLGVFQAASNTLTPRASKRFPWAVFVTSELVRADLGHRCRERRRRDPDRWGW